MSKLLHGFRQKHPLVNAAFRGMLAFTASEVIGSLGDRCGVSLRHGKQQDPRYKKFVLGHPYLATIHSSLVAPIGEEIVFRHWPSCVLTAHGKNGAQWLAGAVASLAFASGHCGPYGVPVPHFISGMSLWDIQRKDGLKAAITAHAVRNTLGLAFRMVRWHRSKEL